MKDISCIILAGGKGERMDGKDKGLQLYRGRRLIESVIDRISTQVDDIIISANRNLADYRKLGFTVVQDKDAEYKGPLAGITSAITQCKHPWVLVIPCDMPELPADLVARMSQHKAGSSLITIQSNGRHQLIFLMHRSLAPIIKDYLANGQRTVIRWVESVNAHVVVMDNENYFHNINTLEQLTGQH